MEPHSGFVVLVNLEVDKDLQVLLLLFGEMLQFGGRLLGAGKKFLVRGVQELE